MAKDASQALGAPELAGTMVNPSGYAKKATAHAAGRVVGGMAVTWLRAWRWARKRRGGGSARLRASRLPGAERVRDRAREDEDGRLQDEHHRRGARAGAPHGGRVGELDEGKLLSHLRIGFSNGVAWEFDIPRNDKKTAKAVVARLSGAT